MAGNKRERENETAGFPSVKKRRRFSMKYVLHLDCKRLLNTCTYLKFVVEIIFCQGHFIFCDL